MQLNNVKKLILALWDKKFKANIPRKKYSTKSFKIKFRLIKFYNSV